MYCDRFFIHLAALKSNNCYLKSTNQHCFTTGICVGVAHPIIKNLRIQARNAAHNPAADWTLVLQSPSGLFDDTRDAKNFSDDGWKLADEQINARFRGLKLIKIASAATHDSLYIKTYSDFDNSAMGLGLFQGNRGVGMASSDDRIEFLPWNRVNYGSNLKTIDTLGMYPGSCNRLFTDFLDSPLHRCYNMGHTAPHKRCFSSGACLGKVAAIAKNLRIWVKSIPEDPDYKLVLHSPSGNFPVAPGSASFHDHGFKLSDSEINRLAGPVDTIYRIHGNRSPKSLWIKTASPFQSAATAFGLPSNSLVGVAETEEEVVFRPWNRVNLPKAIWTLEKDSCNAFDLQPAIVKKSSNSPHKHHLNFHAGPGAPCHYQIIGDLRIHVKSLEVVGCKPQCGPNAVCKANVCECTNNFRGALCTVPPAPAATCSTDADCGKGLCQAGECKCPQRYTGKRCETDECNGIPCAQGRCFPDTNSCKCQNGWTGEDCSTDLCAGKDCGAGSCNLGACMCPSGTSGDGCKPIVQPTCTDDAGCQHEGTCADSECKCKPGFGGKTCEQDLCQSVDCGANGYCRAGQCICYIGYSGPACEENACQNRDCGHGVCVGNNCECQDGYTGDNCEIPPCVMLCGAHGECLGDTCVCSEGYTGDLCQIPPVCTTTTDCGPNGFMCTNGQCLCRRGYGGRTCQKEVDCSFDTLPEWNPALSYTMTSVWWNDHRWRATCPTTAGEEPGKTLSWIDEGGCPNAMLPGQEAVPHLPAHKAIEQESGAFHSTAKMAAGTCVAVVFTLAAMAAFKKRSAYSGEMLLQ
eukprot:NODE_184_length_2779_cov_51.634615_g170_i0.p1 GENE.NODE_184_length_2779_cov_51.634615_g170_i0~~NODE_184_length_2779_cov_51.634615_g170_i0.p1  ORF type:complete len:904 (+),score=192.53 NODE_184_length_2779_cov_51.634615_g170_i0:308-2713(+)